MPNHPVNDWRALDETTWVVATDFGVYQRPMLEVAGSVGDMPFIPVFELDVDTASSQLVVIRLRGAFKPSRWTALCRLQSLWTPPRLWCLLSDPPTACPFEPSVSWPSPFSLDRSWVGAPGKCGPWQGTWMKAGLERREPGAVHAATGPEEARCLLSAPKTAPNGAPSQS